MIIMVKAHLNGSLSVRSELVLDRRGGVLGNQWYITANRMCKVNVSYFI